MPDVLAAPSGPTRPADAYLEHAAPASLASYIESFWSRAESGIAGTARSHRVMPDGCADIVFSSDSRSASTHVVGTMTRPLIVRDTSSLSYLGVRFRPGVAGVLFGLPASEITDERPSLGDLWRGSDSLAEAIALADDTTGRIRVMSAAIARRLLAAPTTMPPTVLAATHRIAVARGNLSIRSLTADLGVTRQHLARLFAHHVGLSPKMFARVVRMRAVLDRAREATDVDWISVALDAGYYDQSHLIDDVKELTGLPPTAWLGQRG